MKQTHPAIILASTSPRRKDLLLSMGLSFGVVPSDYEEDMTLPFSPTELPVHLAQGKAQAVAKKHPAAIVIGADTIVATGDEVLGKAHTKDEAKKMLLMLSGSTHQVITGLCVIVPQAEVELRTSINDVTFKSLSEAEINWYIDTGEPLEKAGAYAIQGLGGMFVTSITGSYSGIVGLPTEQLYEILIKNKVLSGLS